MTECSIPLKRGESISKGTRWSYCFGGVGRDMAYQLFSTWLFTFILLTNQINLAQQMTLTALFIVSKIWDGFNDPIMGLIIEKTRTRFGKFKPWMLLGVITNSMVLMVIFTSSMFGLTGWSYIIFIFIMYLLWDITFTMNDISYWSMLPSLSSNNSERDRLTSWANLLAGLGAGIAAVSIPMFTAGRFTIGGSNIIAYAVVAAVICAFFIGCQLLTFFGVKEKNIATKQTAPQSGMTFRKMFGIIKGNDQLRWVAIVMLIYNSGAAVLSGLMTMYVYLVYGYEGYLVTVFTIVYGIMGAVPMLIFPYMSHKFGRNQMLKICIATSVAGYLFFFFVGFIKGITGFYALAACGVLINFGQTLFYNILTINISNSVEYNEWKTGSRDEGVIFSLRPLMAKFGGAIHFGIVSLTYAVLNITTVTNYISKVENGVYQGIYAEEDKPALIADALKSIPPETALYMRIVMIVIPIALLILAACVCTKKCTIDEQKYAMILKELAARRAQDAQDGQLDQ